MSFKNTKLHSLVAIMMQQYKDLIRSYFSFRENTIRHLPVKSSLVTCDTIFAVVLFYIENLDLNDKILCNHLEHSDAAIRKCISKLKTTGWVEHVDSGDDGRITFIKPTAKLMESVGKVCELVAQDISSAKRYLRYLSPSTEK